MSIETSLFTQVRDRIVNGEFPPNQRLKSADLAQEYTVSASSMREILFRLSTVGLVAFQEQRGFRVPDQSDALQHDLTQFRIMLESEGAVMSIRRSTIDWESRLMAAHHKLSHIETRFSDGPYDQNLLMLWTRAEQGFHQTLIDACDSDILKETHDMIYHRFRQQLITQDKQFKFVPENVAQHQAILDAVLAKDEDLTRARVHDHLSRNLTRPS
ncbi:GntR family transcriptional regulator [Yoonia sp.]|jgi:DNA-binding GntR family transcriptional regulator|uniref:GntR family transcriptional regulator n=1 Tax=Yoonia sp. TaxID=2212373 RepID=UPI002383AD1C|nr:GntR family transcriptional regulator [Yoonia sp.]MDE0850333.1 GntR family transcriptional regulator [Yoonia sp.]